MAVREIATQLQEDRSKSNLTNANQLVDEIEELKNNASQLSTKPWGKMKEVVSEWRNSMEFALNDSSGLATGDMAMCSWWYNPKVEPKFKEYLEEFKEVEDALAAIKLQPFQELGGKMAQAMNTITPIVKDLHGLPDKLRDIADQAKTNNARPAADIESMKMSLKTDAEMNQSLRDLESCQTRLPELVDMTKLKFQKLAEFFSGAKARLRDVFTVPCPCCWMSAYVMDQPHPGVIQLTKQTDKAMSSLDELKSFPDLLERLQQTLVDLDVTKLSAPVNQFSKLASQRLERLEPFVDEVNPVRFLLLPGKKPLLK